MKDAVVQINGGDCTGAVVSEKGLIISSFHCFYQQLAAISNDSLLILEKGFWANSNAQEISLPNTTVSYLKSMTDVTDKVLKKVKPWMDEPTRFETVETASSTLIKNLQLKDNWRAEIKPMFYGASYYLCLYQDIPKVVLVGCPPLELARFGGEQDNWTWPRHSADFIYIRAIAPDSKEENPNQYIFEISKEGYQEYDFSMVLGYPGTTNRYIYSKGLDMIQELTAPIRTNILNTKLKVWEHYIFNDPKAALKYRSKYALVSNRYKYYKAQQIALNKYHMVDYRIQEEEILTKKLSTLPNSKNLNTKIFDNLDKGYRLLHEKSPDHIFFTEAVLGIELLDFTNNLTDLVFELTREDLTPTEKHALQTQAYRLIDEHFKLYDTDIDQEVATRLLSLYLKHLKGKSLPDAFIELSIKYKNNTYKYAKKVYTKSLFNHIGKCKHLVKHPTIKSIEKDPAYKLLGSLAGHYINETSQQLEKASYLIDKGHRVYLQQLQTLDSTHHYYPDANSTLRASFGTIQGYTPFEAITYYFQTTSEGIIEKSIQSDIYQAPEDVKQKFSDTTYLPHLRVNSQIPIGFLTTHDISGGSSGSPVIDKHGKLIGIAFDGNKEALGEEMVYLEKIQRAIVLDIRYLLFLTHMFNPSKHIIKELKVPPSQE